MTFRAAVEEALRRLGIPADEIKKTGDMAQREIRLQEGSKSDFLFQEIPTKPGVTDESIIQAFMLLFRDRNFLEDCQRRVYEKERAIHLS